MVVYIDVVFLENLIMNYFLIYITSKLVRRKHSIIFFSLSSVIASIYTIIALVYPIDIFRSFIFKLILAIAIIGMAYREKNPKELFKQVLVFYIVTFIYGGVVLSNLKDSHFKIITYISLVSIFLTSIWKIFKDTITKESCMCEIIIKLEDIYIKAKALIDTGHDLKDNTTGEEVIIIQEDSIKEQDELIKILKGQELIIPEEYETRIRILKYNALGVEKGILLGIKVDKVVIYYNGYEIENKNVIIGITGNKFKKYNAIINFNLIERGYVCGNHAII